MTLSAVLFDRVAELSALHVPESDPLVVELACELRCVHRVDIAETAENTCGVRKAFEAIVARCVAAHQYGDNGWRPTT